MRARGRTRAEHHWNCPRRRACGPFLALKVGSEHKILRFHATAVVGDPDQFLATACCHDVDAGCTGVNGIFHQFFDNASRSFDNFAGCDPIDNIVGESDDGHAAS